MYDIAGKTILITGATSGIGRAAATTFAGAGARLILLGRDENKLADVAADTGATTIRCDFEDLRTVAHAASVIAETTSAIDVTINNAGAFYRNHELTVDGNERTLQVNTLAPFMLTRGLLPMITEARRPRVLFTSSQMHRSGHSRLPDPNSRNHFNGSEFSQGTYCDTKFFSAVLTIEFARRYRDIEWANFHPGTVHTGISRTMPILSLLLHTPLNRFLTTTAPESASALLDVVTSSSRYEATYFNQAKPDHSSPETLDEQLAARMWNTALELTDQAIDA